MAAPTPGATNSAPLAREIVINEIMYNPASTNDALEYVELRNITAAAVPLYDPTNPAGLALPVAKSKEEKEAEAKAGKDGKKDAKADAKKDDKPVDPNDPKERAVAEELNHKLVARALRLEGTCTGEHGIGLHKQGFLLDEAGAGAVETMRVLKRALDPKNIMNPGKIIRMMG